MNPETGPLVLLIAVEKIVIKKYYVFILHITCNVDRSYMKQCAGDF